VEAAVAAARRNTAGPVRRSEVCPGLSPARPGSTARRRSKVAERASLSAPTLSRPAAGEGRRRSVRHAHALFPAPCPIEAGLSPVGRGEAGAVFSGAPPGERFEPPAKAGSPAGAVATQLEPTSRPPGCRTRPLEAPGTPGLASPCRGGRRRCRTLPAEGRRVPSISTRPPQRRPIFASAAHRACAPPDRGAITRDPQPRGPLA
jgi:hypothetical protein